MANDPAPAPTRRFPGWRVVAGCFIVLMVNSGLAFYGLAVYLNAFSKEQGWTLGSISFATTIFFVVGGLTGLVAGHLIQRFDVRIVISVGAVIAGASLAVVGQVDQIWQLYASYVIFAFGYALAGLVPTTTVVTRWFHLKRSVALSVASTGLSVGGIVITPFAKALIDEHGLAMTTPWLGVLFVVGTVPAAMFLIRPDPAADGYEPDGAVMSVERPTGPPAGVVAAEAFGSRFYKAITAGYVLALGSQVGGIQQLVKLVEDRTSASTAQFAITVLAATSVVARLVGGRVATSVPLTRLIVVLSGLQALSLAGLAVSTNRIPLFVAIVVFGATIGNILMLQPLLIAERFGVRDYSRIYARTQAVAIVGVAGGPLLIGWLFDLSGDYRWAYLAAAALSLIGAMVLSTAGPAEIEQPAPENEPEPGPLPSPS